MASNNNETIDRKLSDIFTEAFDLLNEINTDNDPTNSLDVQIRIKKCIHLFEDSTRLVSLVGIFSSNENYEEIPTNDLKYFLLPCFLANLHMKLTTGDRNEIVEIADIYYRDFLKRSEEYGFWDSNNHSLVKSNGENVQDEMEILTHMVQDRNSKILKYKAKKKLDDEIKALKLVIERDQDDDSTKREFYIKLIKSNILEAHEEIGSLSTEKQILEHMNKMKSENPNHEKERPKHHQSKPLKPIIITRDVAQKAVYGLGYPSLPIMTVEEFYEQRVADGIFPDPSKVSNQNMMQSRQEFESVEQQDREELEKEQMAEVDDEQYLARNRAMDEYKDEHRRGEGNRHNRS